MTFREIFRFEVAYQLGRGSTRVFGAILLLVPFLLLHAVNGSDGYVNAPERVSEVTTTLALFGLFVTAGLMGDAATRDLQTGMHPLFYAAPIAKADYLGGRFLGALLVNAVLLAGVPLGLLLATLMPYLRPEMFGPFRAAAYVQPYVSLILPNLFLGAALMFAVAALARHTLPAFLAGVALLMFSAVGADVGGGGATPTAGILMDPFGLAAVQDVTRYWTPPERNSRLIGFPALLLWNRLLWIAVGATLLGVLHARFRFAHPGSARRWWFRRRRVVDPGAGTPAGARRAVPAIVVPRTQRTFGAGTRVRQTLAVARRSLEEIAASPLFLVLLAGALVLTFAVGWDVGSIAFETSTWPVTHLIAGTTIGGWVGIAVIVLIAVFAGELVWRERDVRLSEIADAAPVPDWAALLGRFLALVGLIVLLQAVFMVAGVILQTLQGYYEYELGLYVRILFGLKLADYVLFAMLAMTVHVVVNQKYVGHLIVVLCFVFTLFAGPFFGIRHHLLVYGSDPGWVYSDMNGFGPFVGPFVWFKLYWAAWALLLAVAANLLWVRGREGGARRRIGLARARFTGGVARAAAAAALLVLTLGGFVFYNTNVLNHFGSPDEGAERLASYEKRYKRYEHAPQPRIVAAELRVEIRPEARSADLRGSYRLVNRTASAIDSVHVITNPEVEVRSLSFDRGSRQVHADPDLPYRIFALERALQPGDSLLLRFDLAFRPRGFPNAGINTSVAGNGAYFDRRWLPAIGYQPAREMSDPEARRRYGLGPPTPTPGPDDAAARQLRSDARNEDYVDVDAVIGTAADQIAITPGTLQRTWTEHGRRYFHYRTVPPTSFGAPFLSGRFAVREDVWRGVALRIYHHPTHTFNVDRMIRSMKAALDYYTTQFGPYQYDQLRIVEFPRYASFARAHPHTIAFSEGSSFLTRVEDGDIDRPFFVTAHEIAHQWWGGQVAGAAVRGRPMLSETLAQYSAMMVLEKAYGREQLRRFYAFEMDGYLGGRRTFANREVPLLDVEDQRYIYYNKGAIAMYTLRERIGEERVNAALRRFLETWRNAGPPYPTSRDLYRELQAVTPDSVRPLLADLFETATIWDVRADSARAEPTGTGAYRVTLHVRAAKLRTDSLGRESEVPMDDLVEVGVFGPATSGDGGVPLYQQLHRIRSGPQTITVTVPSRPARAGIDPYRLLIDRDGANNVVPVESGAAASGTRRP